MPIELTCTCGKRYRVDEKFAGKTVTCKSCARKLTVPTPAAQQEDDLLGPADEYELNEPAGPVVAKRPTVARKVSSQALQGGRIAPVPTGSSTSASTPGRLYIQIGQVLRCHWILVAVALALMVVGPLITPFVPKLHGMWWVFLFFGPVFLWTKISETRQKMIRGDVCPAVVIAHNPIRVAVMTDLSTDGRPRPAVYVMRAANLVHAAGGTPAVGQYLAAVSYYTGPPKNGSWQGFDPTLVDTVTRNEADIARVTASISDEEWNDLDRYVAEAGTQEPRLYRPS